MRRVELRSAYCWYCDDCGELNYEQPQRAELTDEDAEAAYRHFYQLDDYAELPKNWRDFEMVEIPPVVQCVECKAEFEAMDEEGV